MAEHNEIGKEGELLAVDFLKKKGYKILETNWRFQKMETDIIASIDEFIVVIEVKTRQNNRFGEPESFVNKKKQQFLFKTAHAYINQKKLNKEVRFDIVSILKEEKKNEITHIEHAFSLSH